MWMTRQEPEVSSVEAWPTPHESDPATAAVVHVAIRGQSSLGFFGEVMAELFQSYVREIVILPATAVEEDVHVCMEIRVVEEEGAEELVTAIRAILDWHSL